MSSSRRRDGAGSERSDLSGALLAVGTGSEARSLSGGVSRMASTAASPAIATISSRKASLISGGTLNTSPDGSLYLGGAGETSAVFTLHEPGPE